MDTAQEQNYLPWADDALVRGESLFALVNKLAWFAGCGLEPLIERNTGLGPAKHVMTQLLDLKPKEGMRSVEISPPHCAITIEKNSRGQPALRRVSKLVFRPRYHVPEYDEYAEHCLAQMRVGAWAIERFHDHQVCMCAARELTNGDDGPQYRPLECQISHGCHVGQGFAAWEAGQSKRARDGLSKVLWGEWGLDDQPTRSFAFYVLEKACLGTAIMAFANSDTYFLRNWASRSFAIDLISMRVREADTHQALLWVDTNRLDLNDTCDLYFRDKQVQLEWLKGLMCKSRGIPNDDIPDLNPLEELRESYGAMVRGIANGRWMHHEINIRVT